MKKSVLASTIMLVLLAKCALARSPKSADKTITIHGGSVSAQAATGIAQHIGNSEW
jgi:Fe(3+) dicitrate transport protein